MKRIALVLMVLGMGVASAQLPNANAPQTLSEEQVQSREAKVFDTLDLTRPELAAVAAAWTKHDAVGAERALAQYLRARETVRWGEEPKTGDRGLRVEHDKTLADWAVEGKLQGGQTPYFYTFPEKKIDWHYNATKYMKGVALDNEWQWQINRMAVWGALGRTYAATHDERYAEVFDREMISWIAQCPVADHVDNVPGSAWRTIEAGIRMGGSWPSAFFAFRRAASVSDRDLVLFVSGFLDHANYLRHNSTRLNFLTMEMSGLYSAGTVFPEFKNATEWRAFAAEKLAAEARTQFLPDGAQDELSTEYQNVALGNILKIPQVARWNGRLAELPKGYTEPLEKGYEFQLKIMTPDRFNPKYNNGLPQYLPSIFQLAVENFPGREDFKWVATDGKQGKAPEYTSVYLNRAGDAAMRSDWSHEANYLGIRVGPIGMAHQHQDKLGTVIWAWGRPVVFNTGGGSYEVSKWRVWATSSYGSNCVIVDGLGQNRRTTSPDAWHDPDLVSQGPVEAHWQSNKAFDFVSGVYDEGYGPEREEPASQQRDVLFVKPDLFVVADRLHSKDGKKHSYQARWQLLTTKTAIDRATETLTTTDEGQANLAIVPLIADGVEVRAVSAQETPEILGWNVRKDMDPQTVPATTLLHTVKGAGDKLLLTLFVPLKPGQANPVKAVKAGADGRTATVTMNDGRTLKIAAVGERGITVEETPAGGKAGRNAKGGI
ncbi:MAG: heparinase II/III family protein [Terracidiphilus sp.]|nr:heparinase II/III family protein [Terracidiphilus sp.]